MANKFSFTSSPRRQEYRSDREVEHVLAAGHNRFGVGFIPEGSEGRQVKYGPMVPGPWAFAFGLCSVIDNFGGTGAERKRNLAAGTEHDVEDGDSVTIDGVEFVVRVTRNGFDRRVKLVNA